MKKVMLGVVLGALGWQAVSQWQKPPAPGRERFAEDVSTAALDPEDEEEVEPTSEEVSFSCDGRTTCGQMTSCAEAVYFLNNCPGVEMDGNGDGEPCEMQWCGNAR